MKDSIKLVEDFHKKFKQPILDKPSLNPGDRSDFRYKLIAEEVREYGEAIKEADLVKVADALADTLYAVYGTILEHGLQNKIEDIFEEVHRSNMSKDYHEYKLIKGPGYFKADIKKILDE